jgi:hypothetical protein
VPEIPVLPSNASNDSQQKTKPSATTLANIINCTNNINHVPNQRSNNIAFSREILKGIDTQDTHTFPSAYSDHLCHEERIHLL